MTNLIDLKKLAQDIFSKDLTDTRFKILVLQLYVEHYVNELVCTYCKPQVQEDIRRHLTFPRKLKILLKEDIITDSHERVFACLNSLRDELVHELVVNMKRFNKVLDSHDLGIKMNYHFKTDNIDFKENYDFSQLFRQYKTPKIAQLEIVVICLIGYLDIQLSKALNKEIDQFVIPKKIVENNQLKINFEFMEKQTEDKK